MAEVIKHAGASRQHLTWRAPSRDPELRRAIEQHRLISLHQHTRGSHKDFGEIGFTSGRGVQYLIFPRSVQHFAGRRVIAIRYEELGQALSVGPAPAARTRRKKPSSSATPGKRRGGGDNMVPFPTPAARTRSATAAPAAQKPPAPPPAPRPAADPLVDELRAALDELRAGHDARARARLERLLRSREKAAR